MADNMSHDYKEAVVEFFRKTTGYETLIETGTYYGDMVWANISKFDRIVSIELSAKLYRKAVERFRGCNVELHHGDSTDILPEIMKTLEAPAIFWLDGHYSKGVTARGKKDTPIREELSCILSHHLKHVILIDDARCFGQGDYPTLEEIKQMAVNYEYTLIHDIIRLT